MSGTGALRPGSALRLRKFPKRRRHQQQQQNSPAMLSTPRLDLFGAKAEAEAEAEAKAEAEAAAAEAVGADVPNDEEWGQHRNNLTLEHPSLPAAESPCQCQRAAEQTALTDELREHESRLVYLQSRLARLVDVFAKARAPAAPALAPTPLGAEALRACEGGTESCVTNVTIVSAFEDTDVDSDDDKTDAGGSAFGDVGKVGNDEVRDNDDDDDDDEVEDNDDDKEEGVEDNDDDEVEDNVQNDLAQLKTGIDDGEVQEEGWEEEFKDDDEDGDRASAASFSLDCDLCNAGLQGVASAHLDRLRLIFLGEMATAVGESHRMDLRAWLSACERLRLDVLLGDSRVLVQAFRHCAVARDGRLELGSFQLAVEALLSLSRAFMDAQPVDVSLAFASPPERLELFLSHVHAGSGGLLAFDPNRVEYLKLKALVATNGGPSAPAESAESDTHSDVGSAAREPSKLQVTRQAARQAARQARDEELFASIFQRYCVFGDKANAGTMSGTKFAKMCREAGVTLLMPHAQDVDLCFATVLAAVKHRKVLRLDEVRVALGLLGQRCFFEGDLLVYSQPGYERMRAEILAAFAPA